MAEVENKNKDVNKSKEPTTKKNITNTDKEKKEDLSNKNLTNTKNSKSKNIVNKIQESVEKDLTKNEENVDKQNKKIEAKGKNTKTSTPKAKNPQNKAKSNSSTQINSKQTTKQDPKQEKSKNKEKIVEESIEEKKVYEEQEALQQDKKNKEPISVSLKEIKEVLGNKIKDSQKKNIIKEVLSNICTATVIITYLFIIFMSCRSMEQNILAYDLKVFSMGFAVIGIIILEISYKKDNTKIAFTGAEIILFAMINLCLVYVIKLNFERIFKIVIYISIVIAAYYIIKTLYVLIKNIKKYKKDNNDIKELIKK